MINQHFLREDMYNVEIPKGGVGAELGVARGLNAVNLLHMTKPNKMHLVDLWDERQDAVGKQGQPGSNHILNKSHRASMSHYGELVYNIFKEEIVCGQIEIHRTGIRRWLAKQEDNSLDWVYLDASHRYEETSNEIRDCIRTLKDGGLLCGHDFSVNETWGLGVIASVIEAIQDGLVVLQALSSDNSPSYICRVTKS